ncbi:hypothetical protein MBLNU457_4982t2 [Dothideomycetes sp. NU457]
MSTRGLQHVEQCIARITAHERLNAFISSPSGAQLKDAAKNLEAASSSSTIHGRTIGIKDNIVTKDLSTTAASKILDKYTSPYDATVVSLLRQNGALISGKTNMDEFGMGSHSRPPYSGPVLNHLTRVGAMLSPGGSSGGSAVAVATGQCWAALGTDTGGSVRLPAAYTGTVGFKPSYGLLSRWGVIAYANSLDTVGTLTSNVDDARTLFQVLNYHDQNDPTSLPVSVRDRIRARTKSAKKTLRIGVPLSYNTTSLSPAVKATWQRTLNHLQEQGHTLHPLGLPNTRLALSAYYILAPAEASSNLAKYDGVRYGHRTSGPDAQPSANLPLFAKTRDEGFGEEVKRRILLGAYSLSSQAMDNYFIQAQKVRRVVQQEFDQVYAAPNALYEESAGIVDDHEGKVDVIIAPTAPTLPPTVEEVEAQSPVERYMNDVFTVPASLAGLPAISVPVKLDEGFRGGEGEVTTTGMQVIGQ